jgi:MYXO-CTERM domain-containing protein
MSNYTRGMTVLDISNTADPKEVGFFDTFPVSDNTSFNGAWGVYPYLPSGVILISDISSGLYVVRDNTLDNDQGTVSFDKPKYIVNEGQILEIKVTRESGSEGAVSVKWELLAGATDGDDLALDSGVLNWNSGGSQTQFISIPILDDNITESNEKFFIRLHDPRGSLSLKSPSISVISISANQGTGAVNQAPTVDAGLDISASAGDSVSLQGTMTDEDSRDWSYQWEQLSGTAVSINQSDALTAQFTAPSSEAELTFQLTVTDDAGAAGSDTIQVDVSSPPPAVVTPPQASSGGGGCAVVQSGSGDASMMMLLLGLIVLFLRRRRFIG